MTDCGGGGSLFEVDGVAEFGVEGGFEFFEFLLSVIPVFLRLLLLVLHLLYVFLDECPDLMCWVVLGSYWAGRRSMRRTDSVVLHRHRSFRSRLWCPGADWSSLSVWRGFSPVRPFAGIVWKKCLSSPGPTLSPTPTSCLSSASSINKQSNYINQNIHSKSFTNTSITQLLLTNATFPFINQQFNNYCMNTVCLINASFIFFD